MLSDRHDFWPALVGAAVATASEIRATDGGITQSDDTLTVVFEGDPSFRPGVFGTTFRVPISPDDPLWNKFGPPPDYDAPRWAHLSVIVEVEERYYAIEDEKIPGPDEDGIRWLPEI